MDGQATFWTLIVLIAAIGITLAIKRRDYRRQQRELQAHAMTEAAMRDRWANIVADAGLADDAEGRDAP